MVAFRGVRLATVLASGDVSRKYRYVHGPLPGLLAGAAQPVPLDAPLSIHRRGTDRGVTRRAKAGS